MKQRDSRADEHELTKREREALALENDRGPAGRQAAIQGRVLKGWLISSRQEQKAGKR